MAEVAALIDALRQLKQTGPDAGKVMMSSSGHDMPDPCSFFDFRAGPYPSVIDLWVHCAGYESVREEFEDTVGEAACQVRAADPVCFVHPDLRLYNVLVQDGHVSGFIDWEDSGWFPTAWQAWCVRSRRYGCDGWWLDYFKSQYRFSDETEAAYALTLTPCFLLKDPV